MDESEKIPPIEEPETSSEPITILPERRKASAAMPNQKERRHDYSNSEMFNAKIDLDIETVIRPRAGGLRKLSNKT